MSAPVNLFLLLSALLSALSGVQSGARAAAPAVTMERATAAVASVAARQVRAGERPVAALLLRTPIAIEGVAWRLVSAVPGFGERRRE